MELFLIFSVPLFAYGLSVFAGTIAVHFWGGSSNYGVIFPSWSKSFRHALFAETTAFIVLYLLSSLLIYWDYPLPQPMRWGSFPSIEIVFIWLCATIVSNAVELFVLRVFCGVYPSFLLITSLGIINALCAWSELAHKLRLL